MYKDLRDFIAQVDKLGALRRDRRRRSAVRDRRHHRGRGRDAGLPGAAVRPASRAFRRGFRIFTNAVTNAAARRARARPRSGAAAARCAESLDGEAQDLDSRTSRSPSAMRRSWKTRMRGRRGRPRQISGAGSGTATTAGRIIGSGSIVIMRDPDGGWINASIYRVQVHGRNKVTIQFDHPRPPWRDHRPEILGPGQAVPGAPWSMAKTRRCSSPASNICPPGQSEYEFAGAIKGAPIEIIDGPHTGLPTAGARRDHPRGPSAADERDDAAGRPVRRIHRLLRGRRAPVPGDGGDRHPPSRRSDPARLAADEAAALPFRPAVPRRHDLENLEAAGVTDVTGVWQHVSQLMTVVALKQRYDGHAKRAGADRRRAQLHGRAWWWWWTTTSTRPISPT